MSVSKLVILFLIKLTNKGKKQCLSNDRIKTKTCIDLSLVIAENKTKTGLQDQYSDLNNFEYRYSTLTTGTQL